MDSEKLKEVTDRLNTYRNKVKELEGKVYTVALKKVKELLEDVLYERFKYPENYYETVLTGDSVLIQKDGFELSLYPTNVYLSMGNTSINLDEMVGCGWDYFDKFVNRLRRWMITKDEKDKDYCIKCLSEIFS